MVAYCRLVLQANVNRCHCSGKRLLSAWFAVLRQRPNTVSPALLQHLGGCYCRLVLQANVIGATAVAKGCCQPGIAVLPLLWQTAKYCGRNQALCLQHCCSILVVAHCRLVLQADINRCHYSGKRLWHLRLLTAGLFCR